MNWSDQLPDGVLWCPGNSGCIMRGPGHGLSFFFYRLQKLEAYWLEEKKSTEELCFCGLFPCRTGHAETWCNGLYGIVTNDKEGFLGRLFEESFIGGRVMGNTSLYCSGPWGIHFQSHHGFCYNFFYSEINYFQNVLSPWPFTLSRVFSSEYIFTQILKILICSFFSSYPP